MTAGPLGMPQHHGSAARSPLRPRGPRRPTALSLRCGARPRWRAGVGGQGRDRTADPTLFRRVLYQLSYLTKVVCCDPDGTRTRDLRRDRAAR